MSLRNFYEISPSASKHQIAHQTSLIRRSFLKQFTGLLGFGVITNAGGGVAEDFVQLNQPSETIGRGATDVPFRVRAELSLEGNLHLPENALVSRKLAFRIPIKSTASFDFIEQKVNLTHQDSQREIGFARHYSLANADTTINQTEHHTSLRPMKSGVFAVVDGNEEIIFSNEHRLTREELDLLRLPVTSAKIDEFLPENLRDLDELEPYEVGPPSLKAAFQFSEVTRSQVRGLIKSRGEEITQLEINGNIAGSLGFTDTKIEMIGKINFDSKQRTCSWLALGIHETRDISLAEPGFDISATLKIQKTPSPEAPPISIPIPRSSGQIAPEKLLVEQSFQNLHFAVNTDRSWYMITDAPGIAMMRMIDKTQVIAQCDFRTPPSLAAGKEHSIEDFQVEIIQKLGDQLESLDEIENLASNPSLKTLRIVAKGRAAGIPIRWVFLHFSDTLGRRLIATFTMESGLSERFALSDTQIASTVRFSPLHPNHSEGNGAELQEKPEAG